MAVYLVRFHRCRSGSRKQSARTNRFDRFKHARHYMGFCEQDNVQPRMERHRAGHGARLMAAVTDAGIATRVARLWRGRKADRTFERRLKNSYRLADLCPLCSGPRAYRRGQA